MTTDPMRSRALAVLRTGRCRIINATCDENHDVLIAMALVASSRPGRNPYVVDYLPTDKPAFRCTCRAGMLGEPCPHAEAVRLVTVGDAA